MPVDNTCYGKHIGAGPSFRNICSRGMGLGCRGPIFGDPMLQDNNLFLETSTLKTSRNIYSTVFLRRGEFTSSASGKQNKKS